MTTSTTELALTGGTPVYDLAPPKYPTFDPNVVARIGAFLETGPMQGLSKGHPIIAELETRLAEFHDVPFALGTSSGHGALQSALIGLEITDGDHVLTSPYSWGASVSCILHNNAVPVFADVDPDTGLLDPARLEDALTERTVAILVPHIYGQPADMTAIMDVAGRHGLRVIEDGSQAHGARHRDRRVGAFGDAAGFSTNGVKPIATTEGGYMLTRRSEVYWVATISGQHAGRGELVGRANEPGFPDELRPYVDSLVYTYRPSAITALMVLERLEHLEAENAARRANVAELRTQLDGVRSVRFPDYAADDECVFHMLSLNVDSAHTGVARDTYLRALQAEGVPALRYVERPLNRAPRLSPTWSGPRVMWTSTIARSGIDPAAADIPGCDRKVARSIEIPWNYPTFEPERMAAMAAAFIKVEEQLDALRAFERAG